MLARNGAGLSHRSDDGEARKDVSTGERDRRPSSWSDPNRQGAPRLQAAPRLKSAVTHVYVAAGAEESDAYPLVVVRLNVRWRVISCRDDIQWILQTRSGRTADGLPRWKNRSFCRSRAGLVRCCHEYAGEISGDALVIMSRLPTMFGREL